MAENRYLMIVNNFLHDMATGLWAACVLVVWLLAGRRAGMPAVAAAALTDAMVAVFKLALGALVAIGATGGVRIGYWRRFSVGEERQKRRVLLVKHALFAMVYGAGTVWLYSLVR